MSVVQAAMSAASVLSMGFAGIAGDAVGVREVLFVAGAITGYRVPRGIRRLSPEGGPLDGRR